MAHKDDRRGKRSRRKMKESGIDVEVVVQSANVDVPGQIAKMRNFISQGVDAIIINSSSPTAFDPIFKLAAQKVILVIATDAEYPLKTRFMSVSIRPIIAAKAAIGSPRRFQELFRHKDYQ